MVRSAQYIYAGEITTQEIRIDGGKKSDDVVVGYAWFATFALAISGTVDAILEVYRDGKHMWSGLVTANATTIYVQTGEAYEPGGSGTGPSALTCYLGTQTTADGNLAARTGYNIAYKRKAIVVAIGAFAGDNASSAPALDFVVKKTALIANGTGGFNDWHTYQNISISGNYADANPAHALMYMLKIMLGIPDTMIDIPTFRSAGITLHAEGLGISFLMDNAQSAENWGQEILRTIDAAVWSDLPTGKIKMALIRDDYNRATLSQILDSDIKSLTLDRQAWESFATELTIKYTDRTNNWKEASFRIKNPAARRALGYNKPDNYSYMMISNLTSMQGVMTRLSKKMFYPVLAGKMVVSRSAFPSLGLGQVLKMQSTTFGLADFIIRVTNLGADSFAEQDMEVEFIQDIFGLADLAVTAGAYSLAIPYDWSVGVIQHARVIDALPELANSSAVLAFYTPPSGSPIGVKHYLNNSYVSTAGPRVYGRGILSGALSVGGAVLHQNVIQDGATFDVGSCINVVEVAATRAAFQRLKFTLVIGTPASGWEFIGYQSCALVSGATYRITTLMRGLNNSVIRAHSAGEEVWFFWKDANELPFIPVSPASVNVDLQGFNQRYTGELYDCGTHTYGYLQETPYPVSNVKASRVGNDITITWTPCKRLGMAGYRNPNNFAAGDDAPEGYWEVTWTGGAATVTGSTSVITFARTDAATRAYSIRQVVAGRASAVKQITI